MAALLELTDVSRQYVGPGGNVQALDGVSLSLSPGQFTAVIGPSGCGKSTLLLCSGGLLKPSSGQVKIAETDPYSLAADDRAKLRAEKIGFVFQQFHLVPFLSVRDNILAPAMALGTGVAADVAARTDELIEHFGLSSRRDHTPGAPSAAASVSVRPWPGRCSTNRS